MSRGSHAVTKAAIDLAVDLAFPEKSKPIRRGHRGHPDHYGKPKVPVAVLAPTTPPLPAWVRVVQVVTWGLIPALFVGGLILGH